MRIVNRVSAVRRFWVGVAVTSVTGCASAGAPDGTSEADQAAPRTALIELWDAGVPAFGVFVPSERERGARGPDGERLPALYTVEGGRRLAANPLLDYVFLNLESSYDPEAISEIAEGLAGEKTLLVRIPPISAEGEGAARLRVAEAFERGADGVVIPHVRSPAEARMAVDFFEGIGAEVWSPRNPDGAVIAMIMIEDGGALEAVQEIADTPGYSVLACGIGSLRGALGDRDAAEAGNLEVLRHATRVGVPDMITANSDDVAQRIEEGFLGLLMNGTEADAHITVGRAAAGR